MESRHRPASRLEDQDVRFVMHRRTVARIQRGVINKEGQDTVQIAAGGRRRQRLLRLEQRYTFSLDHELAIYFPADD